MQIKTSIAKTNFTLVSNTGLRDKRLSLQAKGLLALILSYSNGWELSFNSLLYLTSSRKHATSTAISELKNTGYMVVFQYRNNKGQYQTVWILDAEGVKFEHVKNELKKIKHNGFKREKNIEKVNSNYDKLDKDTMSINKKIKNFKQFKNYLIQNFSGKFRITLKSGNPLSLSETTPILLSNSGYFHNCVSNRDFSPDDAKILWNYLFEKKIDVLELCQYFNVH